MRPSIRFLGLAVVGWAGFRAATLGVLPGAELFEIERSEAKPPPILATEFPPIEPVEPAQPFTEDQQAFAYAGAPQAFPPGVRPVAIPVYYPVPTAAPAVSPPARPERLTNILPQPAPNFYGPIRRSTNGRCRGSRRHRCRCDRASPCRGRAFPRHSKRIDSTGCN